MTVTAGNITITCDLPGAEILLRALRFQYRLLGNVCLEDSKKCQALMDDLEQAIWEAKKDEALAKMPKKAAGVHQAGSGV